MSDANESALREQGAGTTGHYKTNYTPPNLGAVKTARKAEAKWRRTLGELLIRSGSTNEHDWLHRFIAERTCRDHCLPSTISELEKDKGIQFERKEVVVPGYSGEPARLMAYRVAPDSMSLARDLLGLNNPFPAGRP